MHHRSSRMPRRSRHAGALPDRRSRPDRAATQHRGAQDRDPGARRPQRLSAHRLEARRRARGAVEHHHARPRRMGRRLERGRRNLRGERQDGGGRGPHQGGAGSITCRRGGSIRSHAGRRRIRPASRRPTSRRSTLSKRYARHLDPAPEVVRIPFEGKEIVGLLRLPKGARAAPLVLTISALDSRKEDNVERGEAFIRRGIATLLVRHAGHRPGAAQGRRRCRTNVLARARLCRRPDRRSIAKRVVVQGGSWSGYWAAKLGILERDRLKAVVVQGGPIHHYFQPEWQTKALGTREYLFDLFPARASVYGAARSRNSSPSDRKCRSRRRA